VIFNEFSYFVLFLLPAVVLFHLASSEFRPWIIGLFGAGFFVYFGYLHFGGFWGSLCVVIFFWEILTSRLYRKGSRWCIFGIVQALSLLILFKYLTFVTTIAHDVALRLHLPPLGPVQKLLLPLGVSFFTFEFIHFAADSYSGKIQRASLAEYVAFILFFPSMVAGPIKRFQDFAPKLREAKFDPALLGRGISRILTGLAKKHALADTFAIFAGRLNGPRLYLAHWYQICGWILCYGLQIYFDFSGYSDIAIGSGYLFGFEIPENFNWPYLSRNVAEFWHRWHISLSTWIRDYVYIPLGGSRHGTFGNAATLIVTFTLSGIWHGAAYNFAVWGLWHGILLVGYRIWRRYCGSLARRIPEVVSIACTFAAVNLGWAFFCMDVNRSWIALSRVLRLA
jgi:alginate O-acetyltransferase complex protein AlgI